MALRMIELYVPSDAEIPELPDNQSMLGRWSENLSENRTLIRMLLPAEKTEAVLDTLEKQFSATEGFRIVLLPVEATIPKIQDESQEAAREVKAARISREELYTVIEGAAKLSPTYIAAVMLSAIVASIGILNSSVAVVIGAMVIAPLLGPNVALSLATTLGDIPLARKALLANAAGILAVLVFSFTLGHFLSIDPGLSEIQSRTRVDLGNIILALASGIAGTLAFTTGISASLIGVMVAVALLPPLVVVGLLAGSGYVVIAWGALLLFLTNLISINLAGVVTFVVQGIRPLMWWEEDKARKATVVAVLMWVALLAVLSILIHLSQKH